ncbi:uncharacterized protein L3040_006526 [Drepanopeziza brunnea f. sp. 'multigermtubi']|uniref:Protein kinase domain-containing protein n=1 Tax=Marssonina brunnea f. sp. multigermtubi (strain MB_m1) TaxID=1072389 RepID=K1Y1L3_MARBU|nr:uncharacterized protein MBM_02271 [Drepanopeziza brunnea f. sp. 'multigermtubi' MB_m1]EKD19034.1 hypothetical protein MBM_02271 [Drepanopeziza brunnea f. sp. 'multigermtubi' MB_m1]KAJ5038847.1 hypothetical protein L3040_006526 [Drepanopeziza brunnea f. sp. 'multigermtubi']
MDGDIIVVPWSPGGLQHIITAGGHHYIGAVDETTILKFPHFKGTGREGLDAESKILQRLGTHDRIIGLVGQHEDGVLLEYAPNRQGICQSKRGSDLQERLLKGLPMLIRRTF